MKTIETKLFQLHSRIAAKAASTNNLEALLQFILGNLLKLSVADSGSLMIYSPVEEKLRLYRSFSDPLIGLQKKFPISEGISGRVFQTGKPVIVEDLAKTSANLEFRRSERSGSFMSLPLRISRKVIGVLNLNRSSGKPGFNASDGMVLGTVLGQIATVIEKTRLLEEGERKTQEIESLYQLTQILHEGREFVPTLRQFLKKLAQSLDLKRSAILTFEEDKEGKEPSFEVLVSFNLKESDFLRISSAVFDSLSGRVSRDDTTEEPPTLHFVENGQNMDLFCLPLPGKGLTNHFLIVSKRQDLTDPEAVASHYRFLHLVSRQLCIAFERHEMLERIHADQEILLENAYHNRIYLDISKELASTLDPHLVLRKTFDHFGRLIPFSSIAILLFDDLEGVYQILVQPFGPVSPVYVSNLKKEILERVREYPFDPPMQSNSKVTAQLYSPQNPKIGKINKFREVMFLPIIFAEKVVGLIHLANAENRPYQAKDLDLTTQFIGIFLTSIKNAIIHKKTEKLAYTDPLTGLHNHRFFQETLKNEFVRAHRYKKPLSLMIIDIDHFKRFNDTYGHLIGDKVIIHVARVFENSVREKIDTVARYGGEEFAVVLPETPLIGARNFAERIRQAVEQNPCKGESGDLPVRISIGVSCTLNAKCKRTSDLIEAADQALYKAKEGGRNQVRIFDKDKIK